MADSTDTRTAPADEVRDARAKALMQAFCDLHKARATLSDPEIDVEEINVLALEREISAIATIISTPADNACHVWEKLGLLRHLYIEDERAGAMVNKQTMRLLGSIEADLLHLGIGSDGAR